MDISSGFMNLSQKISKNNCSILRLTLDHEELSGINEESQSFPNFFSESSKNSSTKSDTDTKSSYMYMKLKSSFTKENKKPSSIIPPKTISSKTKTISKQKIGIEPGFVIKNSGEVTNRHLSA